MKHRKCDTTKYKKQHEKEKKNAVIRKRERIRREAAEAAVWEKRRQEARDRYLKELHQKQSVLRGLQTVLIKRMYQLDPERAASYFAFERIKDIWGITRQTLIRMGSRDPVDMFNFVGYNYHDVLNDVMGEKNE